MAALISAAGNRFLCLDELAPERLKMIFDPVPRVDGIDSSGDPLIELRSEIYLQSGRRRRAAAAT